LLRPPLSKRYRFVPTYATLMVTSTGTYADRASTASK
jgi:hypothetical protein